MPGVDQMISTRLQLNGTNKVKLSFVCSSGPPVFYLFVGRHAQVEWISSGEAFVASRERGDPVLVPPSKASAVVLAKDNPVDAVFFEGKPPKPDDPVWEAAAKVRRIVWIDDTGRGRFKCGNRVDWRIHRRSIRHAAIGGVTDGIFSVFLASRVASDLEWQISSAGVRTTLSRVIDPTKGGRPVDPPLAAVGSLEARNTARGLLEWKKRFDKVCVPTVYSKDKWAVRRLSDTELVDGLDIPGTMRKRMNGRQLAQLSQLKVPGKVVSAVVESLAALVLGNPTHEETPASGDANFQRKRVSMADDQPVANKRRLVGPEVEEPCRAPEESESKERAVLALSTVVDKAVKSDDAPAPVHLFDLRVLDAFPFVVERTFNQGGRGLLDWGKALDRLRGFCLRVWKRRVRRGFVEWLLAQKEGTRTNLKAGMERLGWDACRRVDGASFWEWDCGSTPLFWRWPAIYQEEIWQGAPPRFVGTPPTSKEAQPPYEDMEVRRKVSAKLQKVVDRGYIEIVDDVEKVKSFMFMFDVPKGDSDIRMVYDGSRSGFNESIWAPWFGLPTVETMTRTVLPGGWCGDRDFGEMFLNFMLHPEARAYCGVDLSQLDLDLKGTGLSHKTSLIGSWTRNAMGLRSSPYLSVQSVSRIKRIFLGEPADRKNPFHWKTVVLNLPGSEEYDPSKPWISKLRQDGSVAADLHIYIDDVRITGHAKDLVWRAGSRVAKLCSYFGLQDAPRKLREPSQTPGAWAGSVVATVDGSVTKFVTEERWAKTQKCIRWIANKLGVAGDEWSVGLPVDEDAGKAPKGKIPHKQAERIRGFLIYVSRTYTAMVPYLKGLHLTLDFWREGRDEEGWRAMGGRDEEGKSNQDQVGLLSGSRKAPRFVAVAPRLMDDIRALMELTAFGEAPRMEARATNSAAAYLVGDASGSGFGDCLWVQGEEGMNIAFGSWDKEVSESSSNFREGYNLVLRLERLLEEGAMDRGTELWNFTDNAVAESSFNKGASKSKLLHELCVRLRKAEMTHGLHVNMVWIAGTRMIAQGTDGLSRGDLTSGVMAGDSFLSHIPLDLEAFTRSMPLQEWLENALPREWKWLKTGEDWFIRPFDDALGRHVWDPPPALADMALEQLCEAKLMHPFSSHVFVCPLLLTGRWRKQFLKAVDAWFTVPVGSSIWDNTCHEPVLIGLMCPLLKHSPWAVKRRSAEVDKFRHTMYAMFRDGDPATRGCLRKFWHAAWRESGCM